MVDSYLRRVENLLDIAQRRVLLAFRLNNFQLLLNEDLDVAQLEHTIGERSRDMAVTVAVKRASRHHGDKARYTTNSTCRETEAHLGKVEVPLLLKALQVC